MSDNPQVDDRTPTPPVDMPELGESLLGEARDSSHGRAAVTLTPSGALKQTLLAIVGGNELSEHPAPGPASIQVVTGVATLVVGGEQTRLEAGAWAPIPLDRHGLRAEEDLVALLTVVPGA